MEASERLAMVGDEFDYAVTYRCSGASALRGDIRDNIRGDMRSAQTSFLPDGDSCVAPASPPALAAGASGWRHRLASEWRACHPRRIGDASGEDPIWLLKDLF